MTALTAPRNTPERLGTDLSIGVLAGAVILEGGLVCTNAAGFLVNGASATSLIAQGRAEESVTGGAANGGAVCRVKAGVFRWANSSAGDAITIADRGKDCFIVDNDQVAKTDGGGTRSRAGLIVDVDAQGVWVRTGVAVRS